MKTIKCNYTWISVDEKLPENEDHYHVRYDNGEVDEKPFRIRPSHNIKGFMTTKKVTHWAEIDWSRPIQEDVDMNKFKDTWMNPSKVSI